MGDQFKGFGGRLPRRLFLVLLGLTGAMLPQHLWAAMKRPRAFSAAALDLAQVPTGTQSEVTVYIEGDYRYIVANGIPNHGVGTFPNPGNPNTITTQTHRFRVPVQPAIAPEPTDLTLGRFGVAINGVPFEPGAAEFWQNNPRSGWQYEPLSGAINLGLDSHNAHVQPNGSYHYHGEPTGLIEAVGAVQGMALLGYAADGFPIYGDGGYSDPSDDQSPLQQLRSSYRLKAGQRPGGNSGPGGPYDGTFVQDYEYVSGSGDLDACNGRWGVTPDHPTGTYYYVLTEHFPFIPRQFRGTPDPSFQPLPSERRPGSHPGQRPPGPPPPGAPRPR
jgi:hypothetical protein